MDPARKRQKVSSACQRCRQRKLGCDKYRPCQLCVRASVTCLPRGGSIPRSPTTAQAARADVQGEEHERVNHPTHEDTAVLPELSIVDLSTRIFSRKDRGHGMGYDTSALPGGRKLENLSSTIPTPWREIIGVPLPPKEVLDMLITQFFNSVDWFMMVFHEESFWQEYEGLMASAQVIAPGNNNFLWLALLVISLGAHYLSFTMSRTQDTHSLQQLSKSLLTQIEYRFLHFIGSPNEEAVQLCVLLGSFHLFNARPTVGLGILGSGIKIAQVIGLHRESMWQGLSNVGRESRRRSWWALEVFDKYAAIAFGRPCSIDDSDCSVDLVTDIRLNKEVTPRQAPLLDYHKWKFKLYRIMGPFLGRRLQTRQLETVRNIYNQLVSWESQLPDGLRLETYKDDGTSEQPPLLQMQALALQLTYDNVQIILHRSIAFADSGNGVGLDDKTVYNRSSSFSRQQLFKSAIRTSELHSHRQLLLACRRTHATMHIGICLFTAGVVLCAIALSEPLSDTSQKAKAGIMRILRLQQDEVSSQHLLSAQSVKILEDLVAVVMQSESRFILGRAGMSCSPGSSNYLGRPWSRGNNTASSIRDSPGIFHPTLVDDASNTSRRVAAEGFLGPLQEVFAQHIQYQSPNAGVPSNNTTDEMRENLVGLDQGLLSLDSSAGFSWDGNVFSLADSGLTDASQLWLWSDNVNY